MENMNKNVCYIVSVKKKIQKYEIET